MGSLMYECRESWAAVVWRKSMLWLQSESLDVTPSLKSAFLFDSVTFVYRVFVSAPNCVHTLE